MSRKNSNSEKVLIPIQIQFTVLFSAVMVGLILLYILVNKAFLPTFYMNQKEEALREAYLDVQVLESSESLREDENWTSHLDAISVRYGIAISVVDGDSEYVYTSLNGERNLEFKLFGYILGQDGFFDTEEILETGENYTIRRVGEHGSEYLEMIGRLQNNISFLMRLPVERVRESADVANRFFLYIGLLGTLVGALLIGFVTRRVTNPIVELNNISKRMVELDFEARYTGKSRNEIDLLGENMNHLSESLERSITELKTANLELQKDIKKRDEMDEMRREFIANVSHELKSPIAVIQGYAEGLMEGMGEDADSRDYYCSVIKDEADRMNRMVLQLLNLSTLESGGQEITVERFDAASMVRNYLASAAPLAEQSGIRTVFESSEPTPVWGDEFKAEEILMNYYSNAMHHCKPVDGDAVIRVTFDKLDKVLRVKVFNSGDPIPEDALPRLWEKFYKVDKARTREYGGSGIGLSIVKAIQDSYHQEYGVENSQDGVTFWFDIARR